MMDWNQWSTEPTSDNLYLYPTITDIVDSIIQEEEDRLLDKYPLQHRRNILTEMERPGKCIILSATGDDQNLELLPTSKSKLTFYRGQNQYYDQCLPSLFRGEEKDIEKDWLLSRLQMGELRRCLLSHPVIWDIVISRFSYQDKMHNIQIPVHLEGIGQHYGIKTSLLDITADKWVAAFFAVTKVKDGVYQPINTHNEEDPKYGVFYRYSWMLPNGGMRKDDIQAIGVHYFNRPGRQSALAINLDMKKDFHQVEGVEKIFFRHDNTATEIIYDLSHQGRRLFPQDTLASIMDDFVKGNTFSSEAVEWCRTTYFPFMDEKGFFEMVKGEGYSISDSPVLRFNQVIADKEYEEWKKEGKERFMRQLQVVPIMKIPV